MTPAAADPATRWVRASLAGLVALSLAAAAHTSAGGRLPTTPWLLVLAVVMVVACAGLLGRPASAWRVVALVAGGQLVAHLVMTAASGHGPSGVGHAADRGARAALPPAPVTVEEPGRRTGSYYDLTMGAAPAPAGAGGAAGGDLTVPHWVTHLVDDLTGTNALMALAHLLAAALVGGWMASGERAFWTCVALTGRAAVELVARLRATLALGLRRLVALLETHPPTAGDRPRGIGSASSSSCSALVATVAPRRGPPLPV